MMKKVIMWIRHLPGWSNSFPARLAWLFLFFVGVLALFGPWLSNEKPYYCKLDGIRYFPMLSNVTEATLSNQHPQHAPVDWHRTSFEQIWRAPVSYSYTRIDLAYGTLISPFSRQDKPVSQRHWLGTDMTGRDVLAGMIRGCRVSLWIGLGSMLLALFIGVPIGAMAAWWGNAGYRISLWQILFPLLFMGLAIVILLSPIAGWMKGILVLSCVILGVNSVFIRRSTARKTIPLGIDALATGAISVVDGFPAMFLILVLVALLPVKGWIVIMLVIALLRWPSMARYMRAEVFRMKELNFIKAAQLTNIPATRILMHHVIPFALRPVMISFMFGVASAILAESSLSYLGIGLPAEEINWGRLLAQSRNHFEAWWLVVFPGGAIFFTLAALYVIGNAWQKKFETRQ